MQFRSHIDRQKKENDSQNEYLGRQGLAKSQEYNSSIEVNVPMISRNIQKSTYLQDEDFQQKDDVRQQREIQRSNIYTSQYVGSQKKSSYEQKILQKIIISKERVQIITAQEQDQQEYESISSERSEEEKQQLKAQQVKETLNRKPIQTQQVNTISAYSSKEVRNSQNNEILLQKTHTLRNQTTVRYNNELISSQKNSSKIEQNHATFDLHSYHKNSIKLQGNSLKSQQNVTNKQNLKIQTSQLKSQQTSSYSRLSDNDIKISQHEIGSKKKQEIKYPSLVLSGKQKKSFQNQRSKEMDFEESINYLQSPRNYALTMKKMTSQQSPKRTQSLDRLSEEKSHSQRLRHSYEKRNQSKQRSKQKEQKESVKVQQGSNLFYVSISNQEMYPSLDLKQNTQNITTFRDIKSSVVKQNEFNKIDVKRQATSQKKYQQKPNYQPGLPCRIKILQYHSQFFLKIETQIFSIRVEFPPDQRNIQLKNLGKKQKQKQVIKQSVQTYQIDRRFSDFVFLYEGIMTNHLGYIIYPFPQKSFESFVRIKLQSLIGATVSDATTNYEAEKMQLIEKRIQELQKFVNFLIIHEQLRYSQQLAIFLCRDSQLYQRSRQRIEKYIEEYKLLQTSGNIIMEGKKNIKKAFETGFDMVMKWWGSSPQDKQDMNQRIEKSRQSRIVSVGSSSSISQIDAEFLTYSSTLAICFAKFDLLQKSFIKLLQTHHKLLVFRDMDTEFDYLIKLSAKVSSGKQYSRKLSQVIEIDLIQEISRGRRWLQQSRGQIQKRQELKELIESLKQSLSYSSDASSKISKLERRLERFEKNFRFGFKDMVTQCEAMFEYSRVKFVEQWKQHKTNMRKIWK